MEEFRDGRRPKIILPLMNNCHCHPARVRENQHGSWKLTSNKLREPEKDGMISRLSNERELLSMQIKIQQIEFDERAQESC